MDKLRNLLPFQEGRKKEKQRLHYLNKNKGLVMEDLDATFGPRYNLPIRSFTLQQIIGATNNFSEQAFPGCGSGAFYKGSLEERPVLVKYCLKSNLEVSYFIRDLVITSQMRHHKNVLPLIGCCLESEFPAIVYDNALGHERVTKMMEFPNNGKVISWKNRMMMAKDISSVLIYLHRAFSSPILFRDLKFGKVLMDRNGVAKLFGFDLCIPLPPGEMEVEDRVRGTFGYIDPEYLMKGFVTEKTDVYGIGVIMILLFSGQPTPMFKQGSAELRSHEDGVVPFARHCIENDEFKLFLDPKLFEEGEEDQMLQNLQALSTVAMRCTVNEGENRPEMLDIAKQLSQMDKCLSIS